MEQPVYIDINGIVDPLQIEPENVYPNIVRSVEEKFDQLRTFNPESCIYKVHPRLRKVNPDAYTPVVVSIGPYHQNSGMKEYKLWYSQSLLRYNKEHNNDIMKECICKLKKSEERARKYYAEDIALNDDQFVELMLLDGCFVVEFVCRRTAEFREWDDPILNVPWINSQICRDIMLLENQLPYFVLSELYNITKDRTEERSFRERAIRVCASSMLPKPRLLSKLPERISEDQQIKHLLHLVHLICCPPGQISSENNTGNSKPFSKFLVRISNDQNIKHFRHSVHIICSRFKQIICKNHTRNSRGGQILDQMRSVVELKEFGVRFEKVGKVDKGTDGDDDISIFDVKFDKGLMTVPCFRVEDSTETFFRNLVAYEQHSSDGKLPKYFTDFTFFMDQLINSEKDVKLLRHEGIIVNTLGDDKQVANLFNKLTAEVIFSHKSEFSEVRKDVNEHCAKRCKEAVAILKRDYFGSPWTVISTCAAGALLILTLLQTIAAYLWN